MSAVLLILAAYLLGATPTSLWVGRGLHGVDLRHHGSGNLGATNTFRVLGWKAALPVVSVDVLKGYIPVAFLPGPFGLEGTGWVLAAGGAAILGHAFSFWVGFRGGKGVATGTGVFLALAPWAVLVGLVVWLTAVWATRYVSLGSLLAAAVLPVAVALTPHREGGGVLPFAAGLTAFVIWAHRSNIRRLVRGEENRIGAGGNGGTP